MEQILTYASVRSEKASDESTLWNVHVVEDGGKTVVIGAVDEKHAHSLQHEIDRAAFIEVE